MKVHKKTVSNEQNLVYSDSCFDTCLMLYLYKIKSWKIDHPTTEKILRIRIDRAYSETNKGLCNDEFIKVTNEPAFDMIFKRIRTEGNKINTTGNIFVPSTKIKLLSNERLCLK